MSNNLTVGRSVALSPEALGTVGIVLDTIVGQSVCGRLVDAGESTGKWVRLYVLGNYNTNELQLGQSYNFNLVSMARDLNESFPRDFAFFSPIEVACYFAGARQPEKQAGNQPLLDGVASGFTLA